MSFETLKIEVEDRLNAVSRKTISEMHEVLDGLEADDDAALDWREKRLGRPD